MKRDLARLGATSFDLVIIGGGITGACIARDAARRGVSVALVEQGDFCAATSAGSSKLIHGGLRYLKTLEFGLVRESLRERAMWLRTAPDLVRPLPFLFPAHGAREQVMNRLGPIAYDVLSWGTGTRTAGMKRSRWINPQSARELAPVLDQNRLRGAMLYFDAQMLSPERLCLACLRDASAHGAVLANYVRAESLVRDASGIVGVGVRDLVAGGTLTIGARVVVNAAGPWADLLVANTLPGAPAVRLTRSKGIHLIVPALAARVALTLAHPGGHFFVIPWRDHSLIGTTDTAYDGDPSGVGVTGADIVAFLQVINAAIPAARLGVGDVRYAYAALRPLIASSTGSTYTASRRGEIVSHATQGAPNLISALGGKWTTSRATAELCVDRIVALLGRAAAPCDTAHALLPTTGAGSGGTLAGPELDAAVRRAFESEMAVNLQDVVLRRTGLGTLGKPAPEILAQVAGVAAQINAWSDNTLRQQREDLVTYYDRHSAHA